MENYTNDPQVEQQKASDVLKSVNLMSVGVAVLLSAGMVLDKNSVTVSVLSGVGFYGAIAGLLVLWQPEGLPRVLVNRQQEVTLRRRDVLQYKMHMASVPTQRVGLVDPLRLPDSGPAPLPNFVAPMSEADESVRREAVAWLMQLYGKDGQPDPKKVLTDSPKEKPGRLRIAAPSRPAKQWLVDRRILFSVGNGYLLNVTRCPNVEALQMYLSKATGVPTSPTQAPTIPPPLTGECKMIESRWRKAANSVIATVAADNPSLPEHELRKKLSEAYPFGMRQHHPYKIWLSAVNEHFSTCAVDRKAKTVTVNEGQLPLSMEGEDRV